MKCEGEKSESGALEMCWYLFSWGKDVEVLEPQHLADMLRDHREEWPSLP